MRIPEGYITSVHGFTFWTADGWIWRDDGRGMPNEDALCYYADNPVDDAELGGEA